MWPLVATKLPDWTVKPTPLLATVPTVTTTLPVVAPDGTGTVIELELQIVGVAAVPLKVTLLVPWLEPKLVPAIVTDVPTAPDVTDRLVMLGTTVKVTLLLASPPTVTTTLPVVAPDGTGTVIELELQLVGVAEVPLKVTVLVPWLEPKLVPAIVTDAPTAPDVTDKLVMFGTATVKLTPLVSTPLAWTTTLPVVAPAGTGTVIEVTLQLVGVAVVPLNFTVLVLCVDAKLVPVIVTETPTAPEVGDKCVMVGAAAPVPCRLPDFGLSEALSVIVSVPVRAPTAVGENVTVILQFAPAAREVPQVFVWEKSPVVATEEIVRVAV